MRKVLILVLFAFAACSDTPVAPSLTPLTGTWRIVSIQPESQAVQAAPAGAVYEFIFDGTRVTARVDCNTCNGAFLLSGSSLVIAPGLACTRAACATAAFESAAIAIFSGPHDITVSTSTLILSSSRGRMVLARR